MADEAQSGARRKTAMPSKKTPSWVLHLLLLLTIAYFCYRVATGTPSLVKWILLVLCVAALVISVTLSLLVRWYVARLRTVLIQKGKWDPAHGPLVPMSDALRDKIFEYERRRGFRQ